MEAARGNGEEVGIAEVLRRMELGEVSAREVVEGYLARIEAIDAAGPRLRSVLEVDAAAAEVAERLDRERAAGRVRGPLHGVPILLKDNIETADALHTTAGSLALLEGKVRQDAPVVRRLRQAGAIILGKTNMSEWANWRSTHSSSGWSGRGGQTRNPYVLDRSPGGSSSGSGVAVAANLAMAALGTETDGSIMSPSSANGIVGIKPTVGLTSRQGVIPISPTQDSVGPHARTVADAVLVLQAISERDVDYAAALDAGGLRGARVGVARQFHTGFSVHADTVFEHALDVLRGCGAEVIDDVKVPGHAQLREHFEGTEVNAEGIVLRYEFKAAINAYLATRPDAPVRSLAELIGFNQAHAAEELAYFGQELFEESEACGPLSDERYQRALAQNKSFSRGLAALYAEQHLDALVAPTNAPASPIDLINGERRLGGSAQLAAVAGLPLITVPAGFALDLLPLGLTFMGPAWSEARLIRLAFAFEQAAAARRPPGYLASVNAAA